MNGLKMKKLLKVTLVSFILGSLFSYGTIKFIYYKMEQELVTYLILNEKAKNIQDTYALCNGLLKSNPSKENISSCNNIVKEIEKLSNEIKEKCPYITFYTSYINKIE